MAQKMTKAQKAQAKENKANLLAGKPFLLPNNIDIHRYPMHISLSDEKEVDPGYLHIHGCGWSSDYCTGNAKGTIWLVLTKRWMRKTMTERVRLDRLDFDIEVDNVGRAYKTIDGEKIEVRYGTIY